MTRFAFIVNPIAGNGSAPRKARAAEERLKAAGATVRVHETREAGEARGRAREWAAEADVIVAVGGDGTLSEIIGGLDGSGTIGLVPVGTANVVARDLGIPLNPKRAAEVLLSGRPRALDVGMANGRRFLAMVGVGFDAEIVKRLSERRDGPIKMRSYLSPMVQVVTGLDEPALRVSVDGEEVPDPVFGLLITNTSNYGGIFSMIPEADSSDGLLDFQGRRRSGRWRLARWGLWGLMKRSLPESSAIYRRGRSFRVTSDRPVSVQADGDFLGTTPLDVSLLPEPVRIIVPPARAAASPNGVSS